MVSGRLDSEPGFQAWTHRLDSDLEFKAWIQSTDSEPAFEADISIQNVHSKPELRAAQSLD